MIFYQVHLLVVFMSLFSWKILLVLPIIPSTVSTGSSQPSPCWLLPSLTQVQYSGERYNPRGPDLESWSQLPKSPVSPSLAYPYEGLMKGEIWDYRKLKRKVKKVKLLSRVRFLATPRTDCSLPGCSVRGIFQARILEWVATSFSRGSSRPRDWTQISRIVGRRFTVWATRKVLV